MTDPTLPEHTRARAALKAISSLSTAQDLAPAYKSYVATFPALVRMAGLGQAIATAMAAAGREGGTTAAYRALLGHLEAWLCDHCPWSPYRNAAQPEPATKGRPPKPGGRLLLAVVQGDRAHLLAGEAEALAYLDWLKKLANGLLDEAPAKPAPAEQRP
jgi:CRISPR-associated protein Cmr5